MNEQHSGRSRHQQPPISYIIYKSQRSRSVSNDIEREPKSQSVRILERQLSVSTELVVTPDIEKRSKVSQLIEQFERSKSTHNVHRSIKDLHLLPSITHDTPVLTPSNNTRTVLPKPKREAFKILTQSDSVPQQPSPFTELPIRTITHHSSHSISDKPTSNNFKDKKTRDIHQSNISSDSHTVTSDSMTAVTQRSLPLSEEFIKWQPNDMIKSADNDVNNSIDKNKTILFEHTKEVYATEVTYVKTLYVLSSKLPAKMKESCENDENLIEVFNNVYKSLLNTIRKLYKFHYEILLPQMRQYITGHRTDNMWSILQEHFQTIEDLYKSYYVAYDEYQRESKRLDKSSELKQIHKAMLVCKVYLGNLCPMTELNCPNQRLLRYILLMKTYMKHLDENSPEYEHTSFIHDEFARIAVRCEEQLVVCSAELNRLKTRVDNKPECFDNQQLIWHGSLKKQSAKKRNDISQVYIILFSGCILVYEESGNKLEIKRQLSIENLTVDISESRQIIPTTFYPNIGQQSTGSIYYPFRVNAVEKCYEFLVEKESDREKWVNKIRQTNEDYKNRRSNIYQSFSRSDKQQIGTRAPVWVYDNDVTRCQICNNRFGLKLIPTGRHHCRSCGRCICGSCSTKKLTLKYRYKDGDIRVCDTCYALATGINKPSISSFKITRNPSKTILFGDFRCVSSYSIIWIELQDDYQLHIYSGKLDQVEDYCINLCELRDIKFIEETRTFILKGKDKRYKYSIELNHQNDYIDGNIKNINNKPSFYAKLWYDTMQSVRLKTLPLWYIRKRDSADSGISAVE